MCNEFWLYVGLIGLFGLSHESTAVRCVGFLLSIVTLVFLSIR